MPDTKVFMCSDQCCAMIRDGVLDENNTNPKRMKIKEATSPDMMMPSVLETGKDTGSAEAGDKGSGFDPDWCIVRISDGVPKKKKSIFCHSKFPVENRPGKPIQTRQDLKAYLRAVGSSGPSWER